jgi:hypothetical protein
MTKEKALSSLCEVCIVLQGINPGLEDDIYSANPFFAQIAARRVYFFLAMLTGSPSGGPQIRFC